MANRAAQVHPRELPDLETAITELRSLRDCLRYACSRFEAANLSYGQGTDNAWDEAVWLGLWSLHLPPGQLDPFLDARLTAAERRTLLNLVERRCTDRTPAAYLTGEAWLRGLRFRADPRAIIPRSLIVEALQEVLDDWIPETEPARILDLCTGGASIAICAALHFEHARVDAVDLSADALALATLNLQDHQLSDRIELLQGDLFEPVRGRRYDLILCNPPYVNENSMQALPDEFRSEPTGALAGGVDGMDLVRKILAAAPDHLTEDGFLLVEIGHEATYFEAAFPELEFVYLPVSAGDDQLVLMSRKQLSAAQTPSTRRKAAARTRKSGKQ